MKIVVLTSRFPYPLEKGDKLRLYHQLRILSRNHDIILCSLTDKPVTNPEREALMAFCTRIYLLERNRWMILKNLVLAILSGIPFQVAYFFDRRLKVEFLDILAREKPDYLYCQLIRTALYARGAEVPASIDYMDSFSRWTRKLAQHSRSILKTRFFSWEAKRVANFEKDVFPLFQAHTVISEQDAGSFSHFSKKEDWTILPNGVDTDWFQPMETGSAKFDLAFIGNLGYYNNVEAAKFLVKEIMPLVWRKDPDVTVLLAGARPAKEILHLQENRVRVSGWMEDIRHAYANARVVVAPVFLAVGQQNKILEAMAMGIPTITTTQVNNAICATPDQEILIADNASDFSQQVCKLLGNPALTKKIGNAGREYVLKNYSWASAVEPLKQIIEKRVS